jgi:glycosyltransferase involved in cell wall biosynthesis
MKHHKLFWGSSYDRGCDILLLMWGDIRKSYPDATLDIAYGWDLFDLAAANNKERQEWKRDVQELMKQPGVTEHGRVSKDKLEEIRSECGIWAYPTYFTEIFCITALECQNDGLVPITMSLGALRETACKGILVEGGIYKKEVQDEFKQKLLSLMGDKHEWKRLSNKCQKFARDYDWSKQAQRWTEVFTQPNKDGKISVYTPSLRDGWWNVMSSNLAAQTHKNFEWIIVDAQEQSREATAKKYAQEYGLDIKYIHQPKTNRTYSLCNANNLAIEKATGELFVFLQDFVLLTPTSLEELLNVSRKHPGDFIAPVDNYFAPKIKPDLSNKEDWFNGSLDVIGEFMRKNVRVQNAGVRKGEFITDFEQNFGAVPLSTLKHLNGYWEFYDEALGWDDTEIIYRAKKLGYNLWIDDTNQCICIDHHKTLGKDEGGSSVNRTRRLNDPRYVWMVDQMNKGNLPVIRDPEIEKKIDLQYTIPEEISDENCVKWMRENLQEIIKPWGNV